MATIAEQLTSLAETKTAIKDAIVAKGVTVADTDTFRSYADKIGGIGETVEKTKFGLTIDNLLGSVNQYGYYVAPNDKFDVDLSGVLKISSSSFKYKFYGEKVRNFLANDVIVVDAHGFNAVLGSAIAAYNVEKVSVNSLEEINANYAFYQAIDNCLNSQLAVSFAKLTKVNSEYCFYGFCPLVAFDVANAFPVLEEIAGAYAFSRFCKYNNHTIHFPSVKKITGGSGSLGKATFGSGASGSKWYFPKAVDFTGYIWNFSATYTGEIHFAAANQAAIEACDGYATKWGFAGATIYFDL